jgi:hypothetical protein
MCRNHVTAILTANHSQEKYFKLQSVNDTYCDEVVRVSKIGNETVTKKALEAMVTWIRDDLKDEHGTNNFYKTWSLDSGYGRRSVVFGMYGVNYERGHRGELER